MQKIDTILFDLDGTLVDSNELIIKSFYETMKIYMPERDFSRAELIEMIGPPLKETFLIATNNPNTIEEMIDYYRKIYVDLEFDYIDIYPNTIKMLKAFSEKGFNLGIVTTKFKESAIPSIEHYGLDKYITSYCFLDDITEHKPHPEPIYYALKAFKNHKKVMMVGDNTGDIEAGFNADCLTCGLEWSIKRDLIKELNPDFWIEDYLELIDIIENYNKEE
ncbi:MAG: HAD-IA family hydrolase [Tenericutes bacterium]|nr:HAD-IA family hydrolase [Mycoplasmatota bacterium]